jgi:hypothetical protein
LEWKGITIKKGLINEMNSDDIEATKLKLEKQFFSLTNKEKILLQVIEDEIKEIFPQLNLGKLMYDPNCYGWGCLCDYNKTFYGLDEDDIIIPSIKTALIGQNLQCTKDEMERMLYLLKSKYS